MMSTRAVGVERSSAAAGVDERIERLGARRPTLRWSLQASFVLLVSLFILAAGAAAVFVHVQAGRDARQAALKDAQFAAASAAKQLGSDIAALRAGVASLAANSQIGKAIDHPAGCTLSYAANGAGDKGHLDLLRLNGQAVCSSRVHPAAYGGASWLPRAKVTPLFLAPVRDPATGRWVALASAPVPGHGIAIGFADLVSAVKHLASQYGGGNPAEFLVVARDGRTVLGRSLSPERSIGTRLAQSAGTGERNDLNGRARLYAQAGVTGLGWQLYVGEDKAAALSAVNRLQQGELAIILVGVIAVLLVAWFAYRRLERADEATRMSEESYRLLFERHPAPMWVFDQETSRFLAVNESAVATYGYSRDEFGSMTVDDIRPREDSARLRATIKHSATQLVTTGVWRHRKKDGSTIDASVSSNAIDFEGRPSRLVLVEDVSEQRRLEEQLRQAQKMEAIGNLAGGIAHDFNNILMVIRTCSDLLLDQVSDEHAREDVIAIDSAAKRAVDLTHQLLAFSRQQVLHPQVIDLNSVVVETLGLLQRLIHEDVEVALDLSPDPELILADRSQLVQVVLNLGVNAQDAMPTGGRLTIRTANVELDDSYAATHVGVVPGRHSMLQVTDSGAGMDEETKSRMFDPFFTTKEAGTGLGLATVYGIVKQSGGHIWLYSEIGMGTTFKLYFPRAAAGAANEPSPSEVTALEGNEAVLLVEDDEAVRTLVAKVLRSYGYSVVEAATGTEALQLAEQQGSIDLLMTDVVMPGINGRELAEQLAEKRPNLRVLFSSGYPADTMLRHGISEARTNYIEKPFSPDALARKTREVLDRP